MRPYRLETLLALRSRAEDRARAALGGALAAEALHAALRAGAAARVSAHAGRVEREASWAPSYAAAAALALASRHAGRLRAEGEALAAALRESEAALARAAEQAAAARDALARARSAVRALERHRARWLGERRRARERREELEAEEGFSARRAGP